MTKTPGFRDGRRPSLLVLTSTYPRWAMDPEPGFVHELSKRLTNNFRVIVLCPHASGAPSTETLDGVEVIRYRYAPEKLETLVNDGGIVGNLRREKWKLLLVPVFILAQAWAVWRLLRRERIDVVHAHWLIPQGFIVALLRGLSGRKVPFVVTSHGADLYALNGGLLTAIKRFVIGKASAVTVVSSAMIHVLRSADVDLSKASVMPMGVDLRARFTPDSHVERSSREVLFVGRLVEKKGVRHLLAAMQLVLRRLPDAHLTIAGFGPEKSALQAQVDALGIARHVRFLGAVPQQDLPDLYRRAALFVAPFVRAESGDQEGLGLVLIEAIGCGCPILAGRVPALSEVLGGEFEDMAIDPHDHVLMSDQIIAALTGLDATHGRAMQLRESLAKRFEWEQVADGYARLLSQISVA